MAQQQKQRAKGRKINRQKKHQAAIYSAENRAEKNRKRRIRRHVRRHPLDLQNVKRFEDEFGPFGPIGFDTSQGRKRLMRAAAAWLRQQGIA